MVSDVIKKIMKDKGITGKQLAEYIGMSPQSLTNKFSRDTWQVDELISILEFLDCKLVIQPNPGAQYILLDKRKPF